MSIGINYYGELRLVGCGKVGVFTRDDFKIIEGRNWRNLSGDEKLEDLFGEDVMIGCFINDKGEESYIFGRTPEFVRRDLDRYN